MNNQAKNILDNRQAILDSDYNYLDKIRMAYALELHSQKEIINNKLNELLSFKDPQWQKIYGEEFNNLNRKYFSLIIELKDLLNNSQITANRVLNVTGISIK